MFNALAWFERDLRRRDHVSAGDFVRRRVPERGTAACPRPIVEECAALSSARQHRQALRAAAAEPMHRQALF